MSSKEDHKFYDSRRWRNARRKALIAAGFKSCIDGSDVSGKGRAHVDHIRERKIAPELQLDPLNLRVMSGSQHNQRHAKSFYDPRRRGCDESGWPKGPAHPWNKWRRHHPVDLKVNEPE